MPWHVNPGPTGPTQYYTLPPGLTGLTGTQAANTLAQVVALLLESNMVPTTDPGITGAVWNNNYVATVSKGLTGP